MLDSAEELDRIEVVMLDVDICIVVPIPPIGCSRSCSSLFLSGKIRYALHERRIHAEAKTKQEIHGCLDQLHISNPNCRHTTTLKREFAFNVELFVWYRVQEEVVRAKHIDP